MTHAEQTIAAELLRQLDAANARLATLEQRLRAALDSEDPIALSVEVAGVIGALSVPVASPAMLRYYRSELQLPPA